MAELPPEQFELLNGYLEYKYFMPEITRVYSIRDNMRGAIFVKTDTTAGEKDDMRSRLVSEFPTAERQLSLRQRRRRQQIFLSRHQQA